MPLLFLVLLSVLFGLTHGLYRLYYSRRHHDQKEDKQHAPTITTTTTTLSPPYPTQPIRGRERYRVMMDIRRLDVANWLTVDQNYLAEHAIRSQLLAQEKSKVLQCLPESLDGCYEALEEVVDFLNHRFGQVFVTTGEKQTIHNTITGETFSYGPENKANALEVAVRLTMEDLSILMTNEDGEYYLAASASLFPVGWTVDERIGWTIARLHSPVPLWQQQVANSVSKFLSRLTTTSPMERSNYFVEVRRPDENLLETLYRPQGLSEEALDPTAHEIIIRRERQTFRRLPRTGAILFGVKTVLTTLDELPDAELRNFAREMKSWPEYVGEYKGYPVWGKKVLEYCSLKNIEV